ncbi:MAG TPA: TlpA disulfide reductase family protein [Candidatus Acidoferrum sp.]|nr:TlpA disulfide reductase family protein [Candidatus Acidoferrum sp.]
MLNLAGCKGNSFFASMLKASAKPGATGATGTAGGMMEPDVTFQGLDGKDVSLAGLKGKVVVVNFWATWCDPCRIEIPWMIAFQQQYASQGFTMLGVAMDEEGKSVVGPFVATTQFDVDGKQTTMNYPIVLGNDDLASKFGGLIGLPTTVVIGRDGRIEKRFIGLASHDELEKTIQSLLQNQKTA